MPETLSSTQSLGGISVEIAGNLSPLRAAVAEGKAIAAQAEKQLAIRVPMSLGTSGAGVGGSTFGSVNMGAAAGSVNHGTAIAGLQNWAASSAGINRVSTMAQQSRWTDARAAGEKEGEAYAEGVDRGYQRIRSRLRASGGEGGGGGESRWGRFNPFSARGLDRAFGSAAAAFVVSEGMKIGGEFTRASMLHGSASFVNQQQGTLAMINAGESVPFVGGLVSSVDQMQAGLGAGGRFLYGGRNTASEAIQSNIDESLLQSTSVRSARRASFAVRAAIAAASGNPLGAIGLQNEGQLMEAKEVALHAGGWGAGLVNDIGALGATQMENARRAQYSEYAVANSNVNSAEYFAAGAQQRINGNTRAGMTQELFGGRAAINGGRDAALSAERDPAKRATIERNAQAQLIQFEAQAALQLEQFRREKAVDSETAIASKREATLRLTKDNYRADLEAFDAATKAKIDSLSDLEAKQNEASRRSDQRLVMVSQQQQQITSSNRLMLVSGQAGLLRSVNRGDEADIGEFTAQREEQRKNIDVQNRAAFDRQTSDLGLAILINQDRARADRSASFVTRRQVAGAISSNEPQAAAMIGVIAGMQSELRNGRPEERGNTIDTQRYELQAMRHELLRPHQFAAEGDPLRDVPGGPGGQTGQDMLDALKTIADYLQTIKDNSNKGNTLGN